MQTIELLKCRAGAAIVLRVVAAVVYLCALSLGASAQDDTRISATWQVVKYDITATVPQAENDRNLVAKAKLDLKNISARPATTITLRISPSAEVSNVTVNGTVATFTK